MSVALHKGTAAVATGWPLISFLITTAFYLYESRKTEIKGSQPNLLFLCATACLYLWITNDKASPFTSEKSQKTFPNMEAFWCVSLLQWTDKLWLEGPFMKGVAIWRIKCNPNCNDDSSRILRSCLSQVSLFSLLSYVLIPISQMLATLWVVPGLFLAQLSCFPTSHILWCLLKGKNHSASFITCFTCSELSQSLGETSFIPCTTGQRSPLGGVVLGCKDSVARSGHFPSGFHLGRSRVLILASSACTGRCSLCTNPCLEGCAEAIPALSLCAQGNLYRTEQTRAKHLPSTTDHGPGPSVCLCVQ